MASSSAGTLSCTSNRREYSLQSPTRAAVRTLGRLSSIREPTLRSRAESGSMRSPHASQTAVTSADRTFSSGSMMRSFSAGMRRSAKEEWMLTSFTPCSTATRRTSEETSWNLVTKAFRSIGYSCTILWLEDNSNNSATRLTPFSRADSSSIATTSVSCGSKYFTSSGDADVTSTMSRGHSSRRSESMTDTTADGRHNCKKW
mmetsp:Transcript_33367/g.107994  ORF Transcript_33367/g.107994 Transcript_33367/m.107994 type:complete len:202 (-) Transcript_33367:697-1302(-)